jgi:hypothetical protein
MTQALVQCPGCGRPSACSCTPETIRAALAADRAEVSRRAGESFARINAQVSEITQLRCDLAIARDQLREQHRRAHDLIDSIGVAIATVEAVAEKDGSDEGAEGARECMRAVAKLREKWVTQSNALMDSLSEGKEP